MTFVMMILASMLAAFFGSLVGLGGGMILVPILIILHNNVPGFEWATTQTIVGIALVAMIFTALSSLRAYMRIKTVDYKTGAILLTGTIPGSILGTWLNGTLDTTNFSLYFGIFLFVIGTLSSLFGIGGGIIAVPAMIILFNMPVQIATATSMFMVFFTSVFSTTAHAISGNILWEYTIFFIVGAILGGTLGSKVNQ